MLPPTNFTFSGKWLNYDPPSLDPLFTGIVISQDPTGGAQAKPGAKVTIFVGRFVAPPPATTTGATTDTVPTTVP